MEEVDPQLSLHSVDVRQSLSELVGGVDPVHMSPN